MAVFLVFMKLVLVTAGSIFLSATTSPILGAIIVFSLYVFGHATGVLVDLPSNIENTTIRSLLEWVYFVLPNLAAFDIRSEVANGVPVNPAYVLWTIAYGLVWTSVFLILAALAFQDKDV